MSNQPKTPRTVTLAEIVVFLFVFAFLSTVGGVALFVVWPLMGAK